MIWGSASKVVSQLPFQALIMTTYQHAIVDGSSIFYREAGPKDASTVLLLHRFPTSSHMFRNLIPLLADHFHVVAPDLPGFGFSDAPDREHFRYTFESLAKVADRFTQTLALERYAILCLRLRSARGTPASIGASGPDHLDRVAERQRL
jgi:alpha-beta hydrolase superfamily lysophospholipase